MRVEETIIKSTLKYLVKKQIEEGSVGFAVDNDPDHDCCWDDVLAWIEAQPCEDAVSREAVIDGIERYIEKAQSTGTKDDFISFQELVVKQLPSVTPRRDLVETSQDCISREEAKQFLYERIDRLNDDELYDIFSRIIDDMYNELPSVKPKYADEEIDKAQAVEQAYVDKMVELAVEETRREWLNSSDTNSATKCFEAVNLLKQRLEGEE